MRRVRIAIWPVLLFWGVVAGCTSQPLPSEQVSQEIDEILSQRSAEDDAKAQRCLRLGVYDEVEVIDEERLIFRGIGGKVWLNQLRQRCIGMRPNDTVLLELRDGRVCNLDTVSTVDKFLFWGRKSASCSLGNFEPISEEQAKLLEELLQR